MLAACVLTFCALGPAPAQNIPILTNLFKLNAGTYDDLVLSGNNNRGVAINPVTGNILYTSTAGGSNHVTVLDGQTGAFLRTLDATGVSGGTLHLLGVRAASDGAVYAMNLGGPANFLKVYRWESEEDPNPPVNVLFHSAPPVRTGDSFDLRGEGTNTQIIAAGSGGNQ